MKTALIVEDVRETREWLSVLLEKTFPGIVIDHAASVASGCEKIQQKTYDLALIDLCLPDGSGIDCIELRTRLCPEKATVVSTSFEDDRYLFSALQAGATGYLLKDQTEDELIALLQGIVRGYPALSPIIARKMMSYFTFRHHAEDTPLSQSEKSVLSYIAKGYTVRETAAILSKSPHTVSTQLKSLYRKLNVRSRAEATRKAMDMGLS